jgi:carboxylesterase
MFRGLYHWGVRVLLLAALMLSAMSCGGRRAAIREAESTPRDPVTGVILGAEPVRIDRGRAGACLLLHGWITTPADFGDLPRDLEEAGWDVYAPLQYGHGTSPLDLEDVTADRLLEVARRRYRDVLARYDRVVLIGFSMGGCMATILASEAPPDRLVLVAPFYGVEYKWYYVLPPRWWNAILTPLIGYVRRNPDMVRVNRPEGRDEIITYESFPTTATAALFELRRRVLEDADLGRLAMPVLLIYSTGDDVCSPEAMEDVFARLPSQQKEKLVFGLSNHHVFHDYDRRQTVDAVLRFAGSP